MANLSAVVSFNLFIGLCGPSDRFGIRAVYAHESSLDTNRGQMLEPQGNKQMGRRGLWYVCLNTSPVLRLVIDLAWWAFVDLALAVLPRTFIWQLKLSIMKKVALCCIFRLGCLVSLVSMRSRHSSKGRTFSAAICAAVKASMLHTLTAHSDLTCMSFMSSKSLSKEERTQLTVLP